MKLARRFFLLSSFIFFAILGVGAEEKRNLNVKIEQVISKDYPEMTAYTVIKNDKGELVSGLAPGLFSFRIGYCRNKSKIEDSSFSHVG